MTPKQKWLLVGVITLAIAFRFYQIMVLPGGLFPDEAANGLDITLIEQGQVQPFYERGNGREALFFYMLYASVEFLGIGHWQHHIVSALVGVISVVGCYLVTYQLFSIFSKKKPDEEDNTQNDTESFLAIKARAINLALLASFFMAVSTWHVVLSRTAFRANLIPLFTSFTFYFLLLTYKAETKAKRYFWAAVTGATFALGFYSYIAYRIMVPLVAIAILWPILVDIFKTPRFKQIKKYFLPALASVVAFSAFIYPLAHYFYTHAGSFIGRSGQVSVFNPELNGGNLIGTILEVTRLSLLGYFWNGDLNWRHNISGEPFLSIIISPFFGIALVGATLLAARYMFTPVKNKLDWKYFLLAGWFWSMLIPVVTTAEGIPHGLRAIGTIPVVFIFAAVGLTWVLDLANKVVKKFWPQISEWQKKLLTVAFGLKTVVFVIALILQSYFLYFVYAANSPENYYSFRSDLTTVSEYLKQEGCKCNTYLVLDKFSVQTVEYFTTVDWENNNNVANQPYTQVDPEDSWKLADLKKGDKIIFTQSSIFDIKKFKQYNPKAMLTVEKRNKFNQTVMAVYEIK